MFLPLFLAHMHIFMNLKTLDIEVVCLWLMPFVCDIALHTASPLNRCRIDTIQNRYILHTHTHTHTHTHIFIYIFVYRYILFNTCVYCLPLLQSQDLHCLWKEVLKVVHGNKIMECEHQVNSSGGRLQDYPEMRQDDPLATILIGTLGVFVALLGNSTLISQKRHDLQSATDWRVRSFEISRFFLWGKFWVSPPFF